MTRWYSYSKSIDLPNVKTNVNVTYTDRKMSEEMFSQLSDVLPRFHDWDKKNMILWVCSTPEENIEAIEKIVNTELENREEFIKDFVRIPIRISYDPKGEQRSKYLDKPTLIVSGPIFSDLKQRLQKVYIGHELSHVEGVDLGYYEVFLETFFLYANSLATTPKHTMLFNVIHNTCDNISTNEILVDHDFGNELMFQFHEYLSRSELLLEKNKGRVKKFDNLIGGTDVMALLLPLKHKNIQGIDEAEERAYSILSQYESAEEITKRVQSIMDPLTNPPKSFVVERIYQELLEELEELVV
jgi:hypothetical protein